MSTIYRKLRVLWCGVVLCTLLFCCNVLAKPTVTLRIIPETQTIVVGSQETRIVIARVNIEGIKFAWKHKGPGQLEIDSTERKATYYPPLTLAGSSAGVTITVTVTDERGDSSTAQVTLTLVASEQPILKPTPTIIERLPTPTVMPTTPPVPTLDHRIPELLSKAEDYMRRTFLVEPKDGNAFDLYREVLRLDHSNQTARQKIREITLKYKDWGDIAYTQQRDYEKAQRYYQRYQLVAKYVLEDLGDASIAAEQLEIQQRLIELERLLVPPTPTPTVVPTPIPSPTPTVTAKPSATPTPQITATPRKPTPTPSPTPRASPTVDLQVVEQLKSIKAQLDTQVKRYKELLLQEQHGDDVQTQLVNVLQSIIRQLKELERAYRESGDEQLLKRIDTVIETRQTFEQELSNRTP